MPAREHFSLPCFYSKRQIERDEPPYLRSALLEGHVWAFGYFGGVPTRTLLLIWLFQQNPMGCGSGFWG